MQVPRLVKIFSFKIQSDCKTRQSYHFVFQRMRALFKKKKGLGRDALHTLEARPAALRARIQAFGTSRLSIRDNKRKTRLFCSLKCNKCLLLYGDNTACKGKPFSHYTCLRKCKTKKSIFLLLFLFFHHRNISKGSKL